MLLVFGKRRVEVATVEEASKIFCAARDKSGKGARGWPNGAIFEVGKQTAYLSYNGRVWAGTSYQPDAQPLCEAQY